MDLRDSRFMVAGATGALGSRLARALHGDGARVFLAGRDADRLSELADQLGAPAGVLDLARPMDAVDTVFLDLEADSMHHYYAKICLIQILVGERCYLVDPLSEITLDDFLKKLAGKVLVLHGADYDLRMLYQASGFRPHKIYDTMQHQHLAGQLPEEIVEGDFA